MATDKLKKALDCLWYELDMFERTLERPKTTDQYEVNINIESFCIHLRNLTYLLEDKKDKRDIRCSDFGIKGTNVSLPNSNNLNKIDKFCSHLTWDRVEKSKPHWVSGIKDSIRKEIEKEIAVFIKKVPKELFPTFERKKNREDFLKLINCKQ